MQENKEKLKSELKKLYESCREETSPARRQTLYSQFIGKVQQWYNYYCFIPKERKPEVEELGVELLDALNRLIKIKKEPENFFPYLNTVLKTAVAEYYIQINCLKGGIKTSEAITTKIYKITKEMEEEKKKGDLTDNKRALICISNGMDIREYEKIKILQATDDDIDNSEENEDFNNHEQNFINSSDVKLVCENIKAILDKIKTTKERECCRSLFTSYCMKEGWLCNELLSVLDKRVLNYLADKRKRPSYTKIYTEYYPDKEDSATRAKMMIDRFIEKLIKMSQ